ncbi:MAG TPA: hypothetical protein VN622_12660 [Clostridia bacterium]|nr:hypothetical protein [Clostridia bacterium]
MSGEMNSMMTNGLSQDDVLVQLCRKDLLTSRVKVSPLDLLDNSRVTLLESMDVFPLYKVLSPFGAASKRRVIQHFYNDLQEQQSGQGAR